MCKRNKRTRDKRGQFRIDKEEVKYICIVSSRDTFRVNNYIISSLEPVILPVPVKITPALYVVNLKPGHFVVQIDTSIVKS